MKKTLYSIENLELKISLINKKIDYINIEIQKQDRNYKIVVVLLLIVTINIFNLLMKLNDLSIYSF